jgi:hypothetical protein
MMMSRSRRTENKQQRVRKRIQNGGKGKEYGGLEPRGALDHLEGGQRRRSYIFRMWLFLHI